MIKKKIMIMIKRKSRSSPPRGHGIKPIVNEDLSRRPIEEQTNPTTLAHLVIMNHDNDQNHAAHDGRDAHDDNGCNNDKDHHSPWSYCWPTGCLKSPRQSRPTQSGLARLTLHCSAKKKTSITAPLSTITTHHKSKPFPFSPGGCSWTGSPHLSQRCSQQSQSCLMHRTPPGQQLIIDQYGDDDHWHLCLCQVPCRSPGHAWREK